MNVKNIMRSAAEILALNDVVQYLDGELDVSDDITENINQLILAVNMVNNTIASSYIELLGEAKVKSVGTVLPYSSITDKAIIEIKSVVGSSNEKVSYKILPEGLLINYVGECKIEYSFFPDKLTITSDVDYYLKINEITFAMGVVGEYLYIKGDVNDAYMWDKRFKNSIFNTLRPRRSVVLPARRW